MPLRPICPKCGSSMDEGYLLDQGHSGLAQLSWVEGAPERSFWTGLRVKDRARLRVRTFRCVRCAYLESYAPAE